MIRLSLGDARRSLRSSTLSDAVLRAVFGYRPANRIADPRLEALRAYAVTYRTGNRDADAKNLRVALAADVEAGTLAEARRVIDTHAPRRSAVRLRRTMAVALVLLALTACLYRIVAAEIGDGAPALMVVGLALVVILPWTLPRSVRRSGG